MVSEFEKLLSDNFRSLERFVNYKINNKEDAQDIVQETCMTASLKFCCLKDSGLCKAWIIRIANNKCNDYYRRKAKITTVSLELLTEDDLKTKSNDNARFAVDDTMEKLSETDRQILCLYYFNDLSQKEIANVLKIPVGTVKSRLYYARENFKRHYPYLPVRNGEKNMKKIT